MIETKSKISVNISIICKSDLYTFLQMINALYPFLCTWLPKKEECH